MLRRDSTWNRVRYIHGRAIESRRIWDVQYRQQKEHVSRYGHRYKFSATWTKLAVAGCVMQEQI